MNVEIGADAALFPEKEYIKGIFLAVLGRLSSVHESNSDSVSIVPIDMKRDCADQKRKCNLSSNRLG